MSRPVDRIPPAVVSLADYERTASERLDANAWAYFSGGAGDELTLRWNREAFDSAALVPRLLRGGPGGTTEIRLFDRDFAHPILVAPLAHQGLAHPDAELASVLGAAAQDAGFVASTLSSATLEDIAAHAGARRWFQLYFQPDPTATADLARRAEAAGYEALVVTVDAPISGVRNREQRAGFALPPGLGPANLAKYRTPAPPTAIASAVFDHFMAIAPNWSDVATLTSSTSLPVLVKGVLSPDDAALALAHGAAGVIVSNHGGRTLDTLPAAFDALPAIVDRVAGRAPVLMDGGVRRGTDVLKAIAAGASAVLVGRPIVYGLATAGALGVSHVLRILRDELEIAMALTGCKTLADANRAILTRRS